MLTSGDTMQNQLCRQEHAVVELFHQVPFLQALSVDTAARLAAAALPHHYAANTAIFWEGEPVSGLYLIESGSIKILRITREGREHILHLLSRGDTFNDVAALDGGPNPATAVAHSDSLVWSIGRPELQHCVAQDPQLAWALIENVARRARYLVGLVEDLAMRSVRGRLARLLLAQAEANTGDAVPRLLTQEEMANHLGTVREMVGRALRGLALDGQIAFDRHRIVILDREGLEREAKI